MRQREIVENELNGRVDYDSKRLAYKMFDMSSLGLFVFFSFFILYSSPDRKES